MQKIKNITIAFFTSLIFFSPLKAVDMPVSISAEYFGCKFDENKDFGDLNRFVNKWNKWMDEGNWNNYTGNILTPLYKSPNDEIDFLWVGNTKTITEMALGQSAYRKSNLASAFPAKSCPYSMRARQLVVQDINEDETWNGDEFVVAYHYCSLKEGKSIEDAFNAQKSRLEIWRALGDSRGARIVLPSHGSGPLMGDTDFVLLMSHASLEKWGNNLDNFYGRELDNPTAEVFSCKNPVLYTGQTIREQI